MITSSRGWPGRRPRGGRDLAVSATVPGSAGLGAGLLSALVVAGCMPTTSVLRNTAGLDSVRERPRVVVMRPDVKVAVMTAGGLTLQREEWSVDARANLRAAAEVEAGRRGIELIFADPEAAPSPAELVYERLYAAVGSTIDESIYQRKIPSKTGRLDWSLGPGVAELGRQYDADYAMFLVYRTTRSSTTRRALAAASVVVMPGAYIGRTGQSGFLSLVDLRTGDLVWFTRVSSSLADVRDRDGADAIMARLFKQFPEP